jgi:hypothetical protein
MVSAPHPARPRTVSVVVRADNCERSLRDNVLSILDESYDDLEGIVAQEVELEAHPGVGGAAFARRFGGVR